MSHTRTYKPVYNTPTEEYMMMIKELLKDNQYTIGVNPQRFDGRISNGSEMVKRNNMHFTMFYREDIFSITLGSIVKERREKGYSIYEAGDHDKSVHIPHMHFIKEIPETVTVVGQPRFMESMGIE